MVNRIIDLENHISITSANEIENIIRPIRDTLDISFFRYLKLNKNGKRVVLSNNPDAIRYMYGEGHYRELWYDGEFPEFLKEGWHAWHINRLLDSREIEDKIENDLISLLKVRHGYTFIQESLNCYEIFSFDAANKLIYNVDKSLLIQFIFYFRQQAKKLIEIAEDTPIVIPIANQHSKILNQNVDALRSFFEKNKINRYYLGEKYGNAYLTAKEAVCVRWLIEGKSADEIAKIENIHLKTVQRHFENIKLKFNCQKQTQVIQVILESGVKLFER